MRICSEHRSNTCGHYLSIPGWVERHLVVKLGLTCQLESLKVGLEEQVRGLDNKIENVKYLKCNFNQADVRTNIYICFACWLRHAFIPKLTGSVEEDDDHLRNVTFVIILFSKVTARGGTWRHTPTPSPKSHSLHWCHQLLKNKYCVQFLISMPPLRTTRWCLKTRLSVQHWRGRPSPHLLRKGVALAS